MVASEMKSNLLSLPSGVVSIFGTLGDDNISALGESEALFGFRGDDVLSSGFNHTPLIGNHGDDTLTVEFNLTDEPLDPVSQVEAYVDGGSGNDKITIDISSDYLLSYIDFSVEVYGGAGSDIIDVSTVSDADSSRVSNVIFGGSGNDKITALAVGGSFSGYDSWAGNTLYGDSGNDHIFATAIVYSNSPLGAENYLDGGSGDDYLSAHTLTDSNVAAPTGSNVLVGGGGNDELVSSHETDGENAIATALVRLAGRKRQRQPDCYNDSSGRVGFSVQSSGRRVRERRSVGGQPRLTLQAGRLQRPTFWTAGPGATCCGRASRLTL